MTTSLLERADTGFKQLRRRRAELQEERVRLQADIIKLKDGGRSQDELQQATSRLREAKEEIYALNGPYELAKRRAHESAVKRIKESSEYKKAVLDAALGWLAAIDRCRPLVDLMEQAHQAGLNLPALPPTIGGTAQIKAWIATMIAAGVLNREALPAPLQQLIGDRS